MKKIILALLLLTLGSCSLEPIDGYEDYDIFTYEGGYYD